MTTIGANTAFSGALQGLLAGSASANFVLAAGIAGKFLNPLGAGPFASSCFPKGWNVDARCGGETRASWTVKTGGEGKAAIDLGDGYSLNLNEHNSEMTITNAKTGETTRIWGDPHVDVNGQHAYDFWGTTTFTLDNGTKITINTEQGQGNPNVYFASSVAITKGNQAIEVTGLSQQTLGDLEVTMGNNGRALDSANDDGFVLHENASGAGWRSAYTGDLATQADLNLTRPGQIFGPGSEEGRTLAGLSFLLGAFLGGAMLFGGLGTEARSSESGRGQWLPRVFDF
ncbi:hypothetical protein FHS95_000640 [Sphingomonas naasensis]|uniref:DUF1521 domain-containing protein n=1 Tax=Sphingomonas naasensis TaxID=1344951 RepID=A0A4V3QXF1_9SPHN|nr:DUF1521 domain-containing protein [Sphingomonas naasensis]NIJ18971.1 hypothetical protein [Sphingomonas naasensis]TGX46182.1 DUF1521 domain-containing protein [Sphingomonas naasensis]